MPDSLPRALTRSSTLRVETPSTPGGADHGASGPCPPAGGGGAGTGRRIRCAARGSPASTSPAVVATVLGLVPLRLLVRCGVRDVAPRADHGGGPEPRPGPRDPARGQATEDARLARSGSTRTSRISMDTAHWFVAGIVGALLSESWSKNWGSHDAPTRADDPGRESRGNCHHTRACCVSRVGAAWRAGRGEALGVSRVV